MWKHSDLSDDELAEMLKSGEIEFGGNLRAKIYGRLDCGHGKRLLRENRVFFENEAEAREFGFRPCGHCMRHRLKAKDRLGQQLELDL